MSEKQNPWLDEGSRFEGQEKKKKDIRDMIFKDNTTHTVRVMPAKNPNEFPFFGYKQHWIPQNGSLIGKPITHGIDDRCAVCDWVSTQWEEVHRLKEEEEMTDKSPEVVAILDKVRKVNAKSKYDMNIIHREDLYVVNEETGEKTLALKRMGAVSTVYKEIFSSAKKWGSPSDEKSGYDLEIVTEGPKEKRVYKVLPDREASPLTKDEVALLNKLYDLRGLRKISTNEEIVKILENAKSPYNEIISFVKEAPVSSNNDSTEAVEKEIQEATKEVKIAKKVEEPVEEVVEEKVEAPVASVNNIEDYECKGDYDENDKLCSDCPVLEACKEAHPYYVKAVNLKIDTDPRTRKTTDVIEDVKKAEGPAIRSRGKKIPF
jgi:hypothetical protein